MYRGADLSYAMEITLEEAAHGKESQIRIPSWDDCDTCKGTGAKPGTSVKTCTTCQGQGQVQMRQGFFSVQQTCPHCHGTGKIIPEPCTACSGQGKIKKQKTLEIKIPAGIDDGQRIRSTGNGEPGQNGGPAGDLYIEIRLRKHDIFEREGDDLHCQVPVSMTTAALGGEIDAPCLTSDACDGRCRAPVNVPAGAQTGKTVRIKGKGMPHLNGKNRGDLVVELFVETPTDLTAHQKELLQELAASLGESQTPRNSSFAGKAKRFWADILGDSKEAAQ